MNLSILAAVLVAGAVLMNRRVADHQGWRAAVTPLASIIGSGFLVLGPILAKAYGRYAPLAMAALCLVAYVFGAAVRRNIARLDDDEAGRGALECHADTLASWTLAFSYVISVAYYANLFGAFGMSLTPWHDPVHAHLLTSALLIAIVVVGWIWGFKLLERLERISVGIKLAIIAGLLVGLAIYFGDKVSAASLVFAPPKQTGWAAITLAFGLIVTVQGFETSRFLGKDYDPGTRIRSMRIAQWLSSAIYLAYIVLFAYALKSPAGPVKETAIVQMMQVVSSILPALLVAAALSAQLSAAMADTSGAGGLFSELTKERISPRQAYAVLVAIGLVLTWTTDIFEIINHASRAFAAYYALQSAIAAAAMLRRGEHRGQAIGYGLLALLGAAIVVFGTPAGG